MCYTDDVASFIETLGPFYEFVELPSKNKKDSNHNIAESFFKDNKALMNAKCNGKLYKINDISLEDSTPDNSSPNKSQATSEDRDTPIPNDDTVLVNASHIYVYAFFLACVQATVLIDKLLLTIFYVLQASCSDNILPPTPDDVCERSHTKDEQIQAVKKFLSDTDTEDEYSDPAEVTLINHYE